MLDLYFNGYNILYMAGNFNIFLDNDLILTYSERYGEQVFGHRTPNRIVEAREALDYGKLSIGTDVQSV